MVIEVIVDIPSAQVNRTFDYGVAEEDQAIIQLGMRVQVPFGNRTLLAFVVKIKEKSDYSGKLKEITGLLDYQSYLSAELVELSEYLANYLHAFRITVLQAMLPSMLKVKYDSVVIVLDAVKLAAELNVDPEKVTSDELERNWLENQISRNKIQRLIKEQLIEIEYRIYDQTTVRKVKYVSPSYSAEELQRILIELDKRSHKQAQLLTYLIEQPLDHAIELKTLAELSNVSVATIKNAIKKGWMTLEEKEEYRKPYQVSHFAQTEAQKLLPMQEEAFKEVLLAIQHEKSQTFLLEGVTGSGKTEVYLQLMEETLKKGQTSILLVPEISLTPQMVQRVIGRFGQRVAVLHSGLSISEKYDEWRRIIRGEAPIVVGARSSIFAPLKNLGLIIIDEEHETSYKQADNPRYHARDVAVWRSEHHSCPLVLGSATPSLESRARAEVGHYQLLSMPERINQRPLPPVEIVDMTQTVVYQQHLEFSPLLETKIREKIAKKEQVVLLLNRRGYASYLLCRSCGYVLQCPRCDISLTYHKFDHQMKCHYCDYQCTVPLHCPQCDSQHMRSQGLGTQKVAETIEELFPGTPVIRMDNDTTKRKGSHAKLLKAFSEQEGAILLGTQMIAKGLDYEKVTLVGVINADTGLNIPDFRAAERSFQLLTQVAGRTGRGKYSGEVIIQTYNPDHYVMKLVQQHDYEQFFYYEMKRRHMGQYPPYYFTTLIRASSKNRSKAQAAIYQIKQKLFQTSQISEEEVLILGPSVAGIERINDYYQFQLMLKYKNRQVIQSDLNQILQEAQETLKEGIFIQIDHEPQYFI
ncbi:primosomal protein N' [Facklamia sp. DSM 111018]|uniref:Replication restart protein PriA n=1 Tax=Facklamia lactis TaxID=2749967 RepID=A0ABS0LMZ1_9LACT|nr:primosomal protein N' [Facklamia lactis]MBG9979794.1 primosomal protein N' [Facklamia lactis]MBG9985526.1 primosomal protein N' [Facklamia lactis]